MQSTWKVAPPWIQLVKTAVNESRALAPPLIQLVKQLCAGEQGYLGQLSAGIAARPAAGRVEQCRRLLPRSGAASAMQAIRGAALPAQAPQFALPGSPPRECGLERGFRQPPTPRRLLGARPMQGAREVGSCGPGLPAARGTRADAAARSPGAVPWAARGGRPGSGAGGVGARSIARPPRVAGPLGGAGKWDRSEDWEPGTFRGSARGAAGVEAQAEPGGSHEMTMARSLEKCRSNKGDSSFPR